MSTLSQSQRILAYLRSGSHLTQLEAYGLFGCTRLAARIADLRSDGHDIRSRMITVESGKCIAEYWFVPPPFEAASAEKHKDQMRMF